MKKEIQDEKKWISLLTEGDKTAFTKLYNLYSPSLLHKLKRLLPDEENVLEIHQATFVKLWDIRESIQAEKGIWSLLYTIARNLVVDYFRTSTSSEALRKAFLTQATLYYELEEPNETLEAVSLALSDAIDKLPAKRKEIFQLCKLEGKSYKEVAQLHHVSVGTIKDHMAKAMRFLKQELGENPYSLLVILLHFFK